MRTDSIKKYTQFFFISDNYPTSHRKEFVNSLYLKTCKWSNFITVSFPISVLFHFFANFRIKFLGLFLGKYKNVQNEYGMDVFTPVILFHPLFWLKFKFLAQIDIYLIIIQLKRFCRKKNINTENNILWVFSPIMHPIINHRFFSKCIYDYYDNNAYNENGELLAKMNHYNNKLIKDVFMVICTSKILFRSSLILNPNSYYIPNGNNYKLFSGKTTSSRIPELEKIKKPVIGYVGRIRNWIDIGLLEYLMINLEDVTFLFIGDTVKNAKDLFNKIEKLPNYFRYNFINPENLMSYMSYFDVAIIPFRLNKFMDGVFPNKFNEYLALGKPIVTTALPDLEEYSELIGYSKTKEEFLNNCKKALNGDFSQRVKHYDQIAYENSWENKAEILNKILREKLGMYAL